MDSRLCLLSLCMVLAGCASSRPGTSPTAVDAAPAATSACVDAATARDIWTRIDKRLNAIMLDPQHRGIAQVATGTALTKMQGYIQTTLVANKLTEREVDTLDSLSVSDPACNRGSLRLVVTITAVADDYLRPDGSIDHSNPLVGAHTHIVETFDRVAGTWRESDSLRLDRVTPSPRFV